jgi:predicted nucleotidyltransferase
MDKSEAIKIANKYANAVKSNYDCVEVILFGSYVKGTSHEESDIDIAVILQGFENPIDIQLELMRLRRKIDSRIEPHPFRLADFDSTNPLVYEIMRYGKRVDNMSID